MPFLVGEIGNEGLVRELRRPKLNRRKRTYEHKVFTARSARRPRYIARTNNICVKNFLPVRRLEGHHCRTVNHCIHAFKLFCETGRIGKLAARPVDAVQLVKIQTRLALPFVSYGGSALVAGALGIAIALSVNAQRNPRKF